MSGLQVMKINTRNRIEVAKQQRALREIVDQIMRSMLKRGVDNNGKSRIWPNQKQVRGNTERNCLPVGGIPENHT